ncbi:hypothetical protein LTR56_006062 [Elasticomyces elasticus]|nr:hypothetical protein LTR56_006062 [Elasticomyces elasticus]KAK3667676.1 hypothetical protein LTR22_001491 [Elasticomyces elasticus]KAK4920829.1 hypothetical protein LTR49_011732 [Elasticomyces elasticus]KAK5767170.1 hypothetical protein LTS12_002628 [Elasticomyces elasticus]
MKRERENNDISSTDLTNDDAGTSTTSVTSDSSETCADAHTLSLSVEAGASPNAASSTTNFRNVSACNRCRNRKNRCDQALPRCSNCQKAKVECVGFDPVSKRAIPRNYVYFLEVRVNNLEALLQANGIACPPPSDDFAISDAIMPMVPFPPQAKEADEASGDVSALDPALQDSNHGHPSNNISKSSNRNASTAKQSAHTTGIPFSRVVYAAVKSSVPSDGTAPKPSSSLSSASASGGGGSDSFFGLNTKPTVKPAPFPDFQLGQKLVELYFEHANPQMPILHRGQFMQLVDRVYTADVKKRKPRELYLLNIVFAIGSGIIMDSLNVEQTVAATETTFDDADAVSNPKKRQRIAKQQYQPEHYHSAAIMHLDSFLGSTAAAEGSGGGLEELQAVLLLAGLALLRPVAPGLWYIIGVAVRLAVDLGLHSEELDASLDDHDPTLASNESASGSLGRRQWTRDMKRRLWWCTYSFDRLVSTCVGRPFGISDQVVTTEFPSLLLDDHITPSGFTKSPTAVGLPTYKLVAHHYFRLRLLQSEVLQVLQHRQAEQVRLLGANRHNEYIHTELPSPFVIRFHSFREWRVDVDRRLWEWKESAPKQEMTGVAFTPLFLELNYWQAVILLYRQSLAVPEPLAGELSPSTGGDIPSPGPTGLEPKEDEEMIFMKVAQAGQTVLKLYRQLHRLKLVNYTFLATHHLFMSGISFLYGDAFTRMSKATISMVMSTTGFGTTSTLGSQPLNSPGTYFQSLSLSRQSTDAQSDLHERITQQPLMPQFDMNLRDLFSDEELANRPPGREIWGDAQLYQGNTQTVPKLNREASTLSILSPQSSNDPSLYQLQYPQQSNATYGTSNRQPYQGFTETVSRTQPDVSFDDLSFLDSFPVSDPSNTWLGGNDGFGTSGTGFDGNGAWEANGGVDLFDGFFFGPQ